MECEDISDTSNNWSDRHYLEIIQEICGQHTGTQRSSITTENSYFRYCTHPAESADVRRTTEPVQERKRQAPGNVRTD